MAVLSFVSGVLEGIGINAVIPMFSLIAGSDADDAISKTIQHFFSYFHLSYTVKFLLIFMVLLFIFKAIALFITQYLSVRIKADYERNTRRRLLQSTFAADWPYLSRQKIGHLDQILTTHVNNSSALLFYIGGAILIVVNLIVYSLIAINISFIIAVLALVLGGLLLLLFKPLFYKNRIISREFVQKYKLLAHYVNENIIGIKTIKSMFVEHQALQKGLLYFDNMRNLNIKVAMLENFTNAVLQPVGLFFIIGIFAFFYKTNAFSFASFAVIVYMINRVFVNIQLSQTQVHKMITQVPHLISVLDYEKEIIRHQEKDSGIKKFNFNHILELKNISFAYQDDARVLSDVSFSIKKGAMIGLIGPSGAGKTTIVDLILRLLRPQAGSILVDGTNVTDFSLGEWRRNVGYVSQDIFLINDTISSNIRFYDDSLSDEDIEAAARLANIYDFIAKQPNGFNTVVGERGVRLSGGQRQRIVLARALARKPQILILDEATSALDNESEVLIQKSIKELKSKTTVIVIAHRLSTIMASDKLYVLDGGKIIEEGAPGELMQDKESYFFKTQNIKK
ncbi:MAG: ABC transporter ATP-binding protein [Patescibacteria group bacterium]